MKNRFRRGSENCGLEVVVSIPEVAFAVKKVVFYSLFNRQAGSMACVSAIVAAIKIQKAALKAAFCIKFKLMEDHDEDTAKGEKVVFSTTAQIISELILHTRRSTSPRIYTIS